MKGIEAGMAAYKGLAKGVQPNWQGLVDNILRKGTPDRVYNLELSLDLKIAAAIFERFGLADGLSADDPWSFQKQQIAVNRFCGLDFVVSRATKMYMPFNTHTAQDTAILKNDAGRTFIDEHRGPITTWEEFEKYPWPDPAKVDVNELDWYCHNLPEGMCIVAVYLGHFAEELSFLMGYETLCYALFDNRDLVAAIAERLEQLYVGFLKTMLRFDRVKIVFASDDMGFKTGLLISPDDTRQFVLKGHKRLAQMSLDAGRPYILHCCGRLSDIIDDLIDDVGIDGKHSFEDTIEGVRHAKHTYGRQTALLGGIDMDFLCRSDEPAIRRRVRETLDACMPGGGYCLGTGNTVANYVPIDNYLAMVDEGMLYEVRGPRS